MSIAASSEPVALEILPGTVSGPFDLASLFGNDRPVELEIGIGKGRFLLAQAGERPEINFLGAEWSLKYLRIVKERAQRAGLKNVRLFRSDARHVLAVLAPEGAFARVHVYCPDPWPKLRHRKRRLFAPATAPHFERVLSPGGFLDLSTDVQEYFEEIRALLSVGTGLRAAVDPLFPIENPEGRTSYEAKYLLGGRPIYRASFVRTAPLAPPGRTPSEVRGSRR